MRNQSAIKNLPRYYAFLLICAFLPQVITDDAAARLILKAIVILVFAFLILMNKFSKVSASAGALIAALALSTILSSLTNGAEGFFSSMVSLGISAITVLFFYDRALRLEPLSKTDTLSFYRIYVYFMLVSCIYNMIVNFEGLTNLYSQTLYGEQEMCSFFDNKNTFGFLLMFGVLSASILRQLTGEKRWMLFVALFVLNELMAMCRTAILLSALLILLSFLWDEKKWSKKLTAASVLVLAIIAVSAVFPQMREYIMDSVFGDTRSVTSRNEYIERLVPNIQGLHVLLGYGDAKAADIVFQYVGKKYFHNTFLAAYTSGGLIRLTFLLWCIGLSLRHCLQLRKRNIKYGNIGLTTLLLYCIYCFAESVMLFDTEMISMTATVFVVSMPMLLYKSCDSGPEVKEVQRHGV